MSFWPFNRESAGKKQQKQIIEKLDKLMATLEERFAAIEASLTEAGDEITAELAKLREQIANGTVTPAALDTIGRIEARAKALADIIPNAPTT